MVKQYSWLVGVAPGARRQDAGPVAVGDQGRDQAQHGCRQALQGRGGGEHSRAAACTPHQISGRLKARGGRDGAGGPRELIARLETANTELRAQTVKLARRRGRPPVSKGPTSEVDGLGRTPASSCWDALTEPTRPCRSLDDRSAQRPARVPGATLRAKRGAGNRSQ